MMSMMQMQFAAQQSKMRGLVIRLEQRDQGIELGGQNYQELASRAQR